jgi:hypothetical protein
MLLWSFQDFLSNKSFRANRTRIRGWEKSGGRTRRTIVRSLTVRPQKIRRQQTPIRGKSLTRRNEKSSNHRSWSTPLIDIRQNSSTRSTENRRKIVAAQKPDLGVRLTASSIIRKETHTDRSEHTLKALNFKPRLNTFFNSYRFPPLKFLNCLTNLKDDFGPILQSMFLIKLMLWWKKNRLYWNLNFFKFLFVGQKFVLTF